MTIAEATLAPGASLLTACDRSVPPILMRMIGARSIDQVQCGQHVQARDHVLFADIQGYTTLTEEQARFTESPITVGCKRLRVPTAPICLAARLEAITREYGAQILISERVLYAMKGPRLPVVRFIAIGTSPRKKR